MTVRTPESVHEFQVTGDRKHFTCLEGNEHCSLIVILFRSINCLKLPCPGFYGQAC
jgi:hypothetical protein